MGKALSFKKYTLAENESVVKAFKSLFTTDNKLLLNYKSIKIGIDSHQFTLIPNRLFKEKDCALYLEKTTTKNTDNTYFSHDKIRFNESQLVYSWNPELVNLLKNYFPSGRMFHSISSLILGWKKQSDIKEGKKFYIFVEMNFFTLAFFEEKELVFINRFKYKTAADFLYYVLMVFDQFEMKPENTPIIISGELVEASDIYKKLYRYIRHIQFIPNLGYYDFDKTFSTLTHYHHFDLYSLKLCE